MFRRRRAEAVQGPAQPGVRMTWYRPPQAHVDTVVFVHGILGHYVATWGKFPALLSDDDDLPQLDILLWGYRTGWIARHHELRIEGGHLVTTLQSLIRADADVVLVGHSMGGLIILKALVDRMKLGEAQNAPCKCITWITLFASPLNGVWLAGLARRLVALPLRLFRTLHKHLHDLARGTFVEDLLVEVRARIYEPPADDAFCRKIPIRIIAATRDGAVDKKDRDFALAPYTNPAAQQLDETHSGVKLPTHLGDPRYKVLVIDLQQTFARTFKRLCIEATDPGTGPVDRAVAFNEMRKRYGKIIRRRIRDIVRPVELHQAAEDEALLLIANYGATHERPPFDVVNRAMIALAAEHADWR